MPLSPTKSVLKEPLNIPSSVFLHRSHPYLKNFLVPEQREGEREMGRAPCCDKANVKKGPWSPEEDAKLKEYIEKHGTGGNWIALPQRAGLKRCGKSCRLRWLNYLRPNIKHGEFSDDEDRIICGLYASIGSRWSIIAAQLPGRTDNDIKNYWNTKLKKKMMGMNPSVSQATLLSVIQNSTPSSSSSSSSSPLSFRDSTNSYCHHPHGSFTGYDQSISYSSINLLSGGHSSCASANSFFQPQESLIQNYGGRDQRVFMFGGEAASCSSSDGSCNNNNNQMSHAKESAEVGYSGDHGNFVEQMMGVHNSNYSYLQSGAEMEETQKLMMGCDGGWWTQKQIGLWEENPALDYEIEEIKQLMSSTSSCNNSLFDENKTQKRAVHYY